MIFSVVQKRVCLYVYTHILAHTANFYMFLWWYHSLGIEKSKPSKRLARLTIMNATFFYLLNITSISKYSKIIAKDSWRETNAHN